MLSQFTWHYEKFHEFNAMRVGLIFALFAFVIPTYWQSANTGAFTSQVDSCN